MLDLVARIPRLPERGEALFAHSFEMFVGGKGANQAIAAKRLGAGHVAFIGRVGTDAFGERIRATLDADGVDTRFVRSDPGAGTGVAMPLVFDDGGNSIISVPRANLRLSVADIEAARETIAGSRALLLQFEASMEANLAAARLARASGVRVVLNTAPVAECPPELLDLVDCLVANEVEAAALAPGRPERPEDQARAFVARGIPVAIVTLGEQGALVATRDAVQAIPAFAVRAVDTVGAGDAFCGALAVALGEGLEVTAAARFASAAGAVAVTRAGAAASLPTREEVEALMGSAPGGEPDRRP